MQKIRRSALVIDDEAPIRAALEWLLVDAGYEVTLAADGRQALEIVHSGLPPTVIVLDLLMPVMSGFEVLSALRTIPAWTSIPVVVLSGTGDYTAEHLGVDALLRKPFDRQSLTAAIDTALLAKRLRPVGGRGGL